MVSTVQSQKVCFDKTRTTRYPTNVYTSAITDSKRLEEAGEDDEFLNKTKEDCLILSADNLSVIKWYVDASFVVHEDYKSHTGAVMTFGCGAVHSMSKKQSSRVGGSR